MGKTRKESSRSSARWSPEEMEYLTKKVALMSANKTPLFIATHLSQHGMLKSRPKLGIYSKIMKEIIPSSATTIEEREIVHHAAISQAYKFGEARVVTSKPVKEIFTRPGIKISEIGNGVYIIQSPS